ncbi:hypothetical protein [Sulfurisphaera tokodaii]|uniref:Uncharacterized protein n=2 Tax=Sulfurisphaera tokodaii TaxID=111955 RepID=Q96XL2_SULTO|nr:hypothetical protein [Sulfurisphaera tokodaii]BAB67615.1 hypothetical protein STK_25040 [Sulfurisphaera tokodaii str. 7]HII75299.1 hypothetical protein [Sulfurisphaera tokodaii]
MSSFSSPSSVDFWIISRLKRENAVPLTIMAEEYAKEKNIPKQSARKVLEKRLKVLVEQGIVEKLKTYPISYTLKRLPKNFILPSSKILRLICSFDLSSNNHNSQILGKSANPKQKIQELRKIGIRVIALANRYRQKALLTAQYKASIRPGTREHSDIAFLYQENIKEWNNSVMVFMNDDEEFMITKVRTRFNDKKRAFMNVIKSSKALDNAFKHHKNAIMITLTVPHIFPLIIPVKDNGKIIGFIPLQDSIITQLKTLMMAWIRQMWKGKDIKVFTAYEYHGDYVLHIHVILFGVPYLIPWDRKFGRKKEDAFTYYVRRYNIPLPSDLETKMKEGKLERKDKTLINKHIFTALLDMWLEKILVRFGSALHMNLLQAYLDYKKKEKLQGPINEIHRIKNGKWKGKPPKDAVIEYSSGACYRKVQSPKQYVLKYVLKMAYLIANSNVANVEEKDQAKVYGYWLFGKRFNSYSPSLLPKEKEVKIPYWHFVGVFRKLDLPDYVMDRLSLDLT